MDGLGAARLDIFEESHRLISKVALKPLRNFYSFACCGIDCSITFHANHAGVSRRLALLLESNLSAPWHMSKRAEVK